MEPRDPCMSPALLAEIGEALEDSTVPYFIELVNLAETDPAFRESAKREGIAWRA